MRGHCATYNRHAVRLSISGEMQVSALPKNGFALQMPLAIQVPLMTREGPTELQQPDAYTRMALVSLIALFVAIVAVWLGYLQSHQTPGGERLFVYCAASVKPPLEAAAREYQKKYGAQIELTLGGSQTLLANVSISGLGDLYIPADDSYIALARQKNLVGEVLPLAEMTAILATAKDQKIQSLAELIKGKLTIAQANPDAAAIGKLVREKLPPAQWDALRARTSVFTATVTEAANDVKLGAAQAAIIWDAMSPQYTNLNLVHLPELEPVKAKIAVAVLKCSRQSAAALRFARFLASADGGLPHFERNGFRIIRGAKGNEGSSN